MKAVMALGIEFMLSVFIFMSVVAFLMIMVGREIYTLQEMSETENLRAESYQISQMILFDEGFPRDWETKSVDEVRRIGLSSEKDYVLNMSKIKRLNELCANYSKVRVFFSKNDIEIGITYVNGTNILDCTSNARGIFRFITERLAIVDGKIIHFNVTVIA